MVATVPLPLSARRLLAASVARSALPCQQCEVVIPTETGVIPRPGRPLKAPVTAGASSMGAGAFILVIAAIVMLYAGH